jgi:hypothetical protein
MGRPCLASSLGLRRVAGWGANDNIASAGPLPTRARAHSLCLQKKEGEPAPSGESVSRWDSCPFVVPWAGPPST